MVKTSKPGKWMVLMLALVVWCIGCSDNDSSGPVQGSSNGDFTRTPESEIQGRIEAIKRLLTKDMYDVIFSGSRNNTSCREVNRAELGLPDTPNGQWYYTYDNLIKEMAEWKEFANEKDENRNKLEIAAAIRLLGLHAIHLGTTRMGFLCLQMFRS